MNKPIQFSIIQKAEHAEHANGQADEQASGQVSKQAQKYPLMRAGIISTQHGDIPTPAFVTVGTKGTVKGLTPEMIQATGADVVLANTYHLYLQPGEELIKKSGGLGKFMKWNGPTMTDSGGFQAFSLGAALGRNITKLIKNGGHSGSKNEFGEIIMPAESESGMKMRNQNSMRSTIPADSAGSPDMQMHEDSVMKPARIDANGVMFRSIIDGSSHYFTPEKSIQIQHGLGADIIFAFDECTSPHEPVHYQQEAMDRTHRWAKTCLEYHQSNPKQASKQALFAVVQGGREERLRKESAKTLSEMMTVGASGESVGFDGFGIGGSFAKEDMSTAVQWVNEILPEDKPRHLLGIGEPTDLFMAIENGCDTFDCVLPTRNGRTGTLFTSKGKINIENAKFRDDLSPIDDGVDNPLNSPMLEGYSKAYIAHLFRAKEMLGPMLASVHNLYFLIELTKRIRRSMLDGTYEEFKAGFLASYAV